MGSDLVAYWEVPLSDGVHKIEFEHGTTSGKRIIRIDGKEIYRKDWMFRLVGSESFKLGKTTCVISIEPNKNFHYDYCLEVNGKSFKKFTEAQTKIMKTWALNFDDEAYRVVLEKNTLDVWVNGERVEANGEFLEDGTITHFMIGKTPAYIRAISSGKKREGLLYSLIVNETEILEAAE